jgi:hypothetical protein
MATKEQQPQAPDEAAKARKAPEPEVVEGSLREALNNGDYGVDYQRSDYSQEAEQDPAIHAESNHSTHRR